MSKFKKIITNWRVILVVTVVILLFVAIYPNPFNKGVVIKSIAKNSSAMLAGVENPKANAPPMSKEVISSMNGVGITNIQDYYNFFSTLKPNETVRVQTTKTIYVLTTKEKFIKIPLNGTENVLVEERVEVNKTVNGTIVPFYEARKVLKEVPKFKTVSAGVEDLGFRVDNAPVTNLRKGLDLQGGTRVLLRPADRISDDTMSMLVESLKQRLNVYGLSDIVVAVVSDKPGFLGEGNKYILVEIAGATEEEVKDLIAKQGKFEASVANKTVFKGGKDVTYVCRTAECSGLDPNRGCGQIAGGGWACTFMFSIALSPEAAQRQADATKDLSVINEPGQRSGYLSDPLILYLDDQEVDRLNVAEDLRGRAVTDIAISGSGSGTTEQNALLSTVENMRRLQTVLITGSLPTKLEIIRIDTISPLLGAKFISNALFTAFIAILAVVAVLMIVYRKIKIAIPIMFTCLLEIFMILGMASLIGWNLDLAGIAGIIISVGTGVNDQVVITDEVLHKKEYAERVYNWKDRIKRAFFVIFSAYFTILAAMLPLLFAGAGLLKGFALTTILGFTAGVFVTRPAFAVIIQALLESEDE